MFSMSLFSLNTWVAKLKFAVFFLFLVFFILLNRHFFQQLTVDARKSENWNKFVVLAFGKNVESSDISRTPVASALRAARSEQPVARASLLKVGSRLDLSRARARLVLVVEPAPIARCLKLSTILRQSKTPLKILRRRG